MTSPTPECPPSLAVTPGRAPAHVWLTVAGLVLLAYAVMGKGAGYIGLPPLFIGDLLLGAGILSLVLLGRIVLTPLPWVLWCVAAFAAWGAVRTLPYLPTHGAEALRDAVLWGYCAFAFVWFFYIRSDIRRFIILLRYYRVFAWLGLVGVAVCWATAYVLGDRVPHWPWADVAMIEPKAGDIMVHLSGILAFWVSLTAVRIGLAQVALLALCAAILGAYERAGMFAFAAAAVLCLLFRPTHPVLKRLFVMGVLALAALGLSGAVIEVPVANSAKVREISFNQFVANVAGVFRPTDAGDLDDTKEWRLNWWGEIMDYTIHGKYFWTGKGFGVNLADDDGFQVMSDHSLRSPHNAHLALLARMGVPGLALWIAAQLGWAWMIGQALLRSVRQGDRRWSGIFLFLLAYWLAFIINASFDVFLEGPMGGIWFWSLFGIGLAAREIWRTHPQLVSDFANPYCP